jgi:hypothetical protein
MIRVGIGIGNDTDAGSVSKKPTLSAFSQAGSVGLVTAYESPELYGFCFGGAAGGVVGPVPPGGFVGRGAGVVAAGSLPLFRDALMRS